jgi:hypothetical protein
VLQRSLPYSQPDLESGRQAIAPLDYIEFARRAGLDAIPCEINWQPGDLPLDSLRNDLPSRLTQAFPPPPLTEIFNRLEGCLRAAQGTRIGVYLSLSGFFSPALQAAGLTDPQALSASEPASQRFLLEHLMDLLMVQQEKIIRAVCDRFSADLAFAVIRDNLFGWPGITLQSGLFQEAVLPRLFRLIAPIREHSLLVGLNSGGCLEEALPLLYKHGFNLIQAMDLRCNDVPAIIATWRSRFTFLGGFPMEYLLSGTREELENRVREYDQGFGKGGGLVMGAAGDLTADVRPDLFLAFSRAIYQL